MMNPNLQRHTMRNHPTLPFVAVLHAMWLSDGDFTAAAKLLRIPAEQLDLALAAENDMRTAYCERPHNWRPEHSLCALAGTRAEEGATFELQVEHTGSRTTIVGRVRRDGDGALTEVVTLRHEAGDATWTAQLVESPCAIAPLERSLACMNAANQCAVELMRNGGVLVNTPTLEITCEPA